MPARKPKVGEAVVHHGRPHAVTKLGRRAAIRDNAAVIVEMVTFENEKYAVLAQMADLVWSDEDGAWYMPGRVLARDERILYEALMGVRPPAETHLTARKLLNGVNYETEVPMDRLVGAVAKRTGLLGKDAEKYAAACLAHCAELKEARNG
jgi:hypothetical protein